jgi:hypothetical protein
MRELVLNVECLSVPSSQKISSIKYQSGRIFSLVFAVIYLQSLYKPCRTSTSTANPPGLNGPASNFRHSRYPPLAPVWVAAYCQGTSGMGSGARDDNRRVTYALAIDDFMAFSACSYPLSASTMNLWHLVDRGLVDRITANRSPSRYGGAHCPVVTLRFCLQGNEAQDSPSSLVPTCRPLEETLKQLLWYNSKLSQGGKEA